MEFHWNCCADGMSMYRIKIYSPTHSGGKQQKRFSRRTGCSFYLSERSKDICKEWNIVNLFSPFLNNSNNKKGEEIENEEELDDHYASPLVLSAIFLYHTADLLRPRQI